jgi:hypothetical protein
VEVLDRIREELAKRPNLAPGVLYHMALQIEPSIGAGSVRDRKRPPAEPREQERAAETRVHEPAAAPEVLQVAAEPERQKAVSRTRRSPRRPRRAEASREQIRSAFLQLARELTKAETRVEVVRVLSRLDQRVDEMMRCFRLGQHASKLSR